MRMAPYVCCVENSGILGKSSRRIICSAIETDSFNERPGSLPLPRCFDPRPFCRSHFGAVAFGAAAVDPRSVVGREAYFVEGMADGAVRTLGPPVR